MDVLDGVPGFIDMAQLLVPDVVRVTICPEVDDDDSDDDTQMNVDGRRDDDEITYIAWLGGA